MGAVMAQYVSLCGGGIFKKKGGGDVCVGVGVLEYVSLCVCWCVDVWVGGYVEGCVFW
jgi:hypothetical protein